MTADILATLYEVIAPIFLMVGIGVLLDKRFHLDLNTLSKLNFHVFVPALAFVKIVETQLSVGELGQVGVFAVVHVLAMLGLSWLLFRGQRLAPCARVMTLGTLFYNAGNFGLPFAALAFPQGSAAGIMAILMVVQNFATFTLGLFLLESDERSLSRTLRQLLKVPLIWAVILALAFSWSGVHVPTVLMVPMTQLGQALVGVALLTLGVQLARTRFSENGLETGLTTCMRLVLSPAIAWLIAWALSLPATLMIVCVVAAGLPVAVNVYVLAAEYRKNEALASQLVFWTTLLSALTLPLLLQWLTPSG